MDDLRRQAEALQKDVASLRRELQVRDARIAELEAELKRRGKTYRPRANAKKQTKKIPDLRKIPHRQHPVSFREPPVPDENTIHHDVRLDCCPHCGDVNHSNWGADAFAILKSVIGTCRKNGGNFLEYGLSVVRARQNGFAVPLPLDSG